MCSTNVRKTKGRTFEREWFYNSGNDSFVLKGEGKGLQSSDKASIEHIRLTRASGKFPSHLSPLNLSLVYVSLACLGVSPRGVTSRRILVQFSCCSRA